MKKLNLDTILAFILIIPFIMTVRISPRETPYWLFGLIFVGLLFYLVLDFVDIKEKIFERSKNIGVWILISVVIFSTFFSAIIVRHESSPIYNIHDIIVQQEAAIRFLIDGKNPYKETYFNTPLKDWNYSDKEVNPALYHFVMQPTYLLFSLPFYPVMGRTIGFFDGRVPLLVLFFVSLFFAFKVVKDGERRRAFILLLGFAPLMINYTLEGRSDFFMYGFLMGGLYFLHKSKLLLSAVFLALAFTVKQSAWLLLPFYLAFLWFRYKNIRKITTPIAVFFLVSGIIIAPFFLWDPKAFLDSTVFYLSGNTTYSYPISGYGFGMLLNEFGVIKSLHDSFPFIIPQIIICAPLLILLIKFLQKNTSTKNLILAYSVFLLVYWYLSRYFNNSHIIYIGILLVTSYFWPSKDENSITKT